jgi:hypothetical protein
MFMYQLRTKFVIKLAVYESLERVFAVFPNYKIKILLWDVSIIVWTVRKQLRDLDIDGKILLKLFSRKWDVCGLDSFDAG